MAWVWSYTSTVLPEMNSNQLVQKGIPIFEEQNIFKKTDNLVIIKVL